MPWPFTGASRKDDGSTDLTTALTDPRVLLASAGLTVSSLVAIRVYKTYLRRIPSTEHLKPDVFRRRTLFGKVTSVGDGDNFRLYHTPGGWLAGWGWGRKVPTERDKLVGQTIHVRLAGIDAPEMAHFGRPAQPYSSDALAFLTDYVLSRRVRVRLWRRDQYGRVVGTAHVRRGLFFRKDVSLAMLRAGMATVYEAKVGSEYGGREKLYREAEERAKRNRIGMWTEERGVWARLMGRKAEERESPREYKTRMAQEESVAGHGKKKDNGVKEQKKS